jgi:hypothetical protein
MSAPLYRLLPLGLGLAALALAGCKKESCLGLEEDCRVTSPCQRLAYTCEASPSLLEVRALTASDRRAGSNGPPGEDTVPGGINAIGARGDILLANDKAVAVLAGPDNPHLLAPGAGSLLDLSNRGRNDDGLNQVLHIVGVLPGDAARYDKYQLIDERPTRVAVQFTGTLDGRPEAVVHTLYEMRPCEPGLRVRTEIINTSVDPSTWAPSDGFYWSGNEALPFVPNQGTGFQHPSFGLTTIASAYQRFPFLVGAQIASPAASYAAVACNTQSIEGFQSDQVSSAGLPATVVGSRDYLVYERFLAVAEGGEVGGAANVAQELRRQLHGESYVSLRGTVSRRVPTGLGREVSVLISEGRLTQEPKERTPWAQLTPREDGSFSARVPTGRDYVVELHAFGRKVADRQLERVEADTDVGTLAVPAQSSRLTLRVEDTSTGAGVTSEVFVIPVDPTTTESTTGTLHGRFGSCAPWLGPPPGPSPACNRVILADGQATVDVPAGRYHLYAFKGPFWTIARDTVTAGSGDLSVTLKLRKLSLQPTGTVGADMHVHGSASWDSSLPERDRVLSFAATDLEVIVATDHDVVYDYATQVRQLALADRMSTVAGMESTGHILWLKRPGSTVPLVVGHYNFWPLEYDPTKPRNGAPYDERIEPGELFDRVKATLPPARQEELVVQLNHPWADAQFGRDLGFPRALGLDLRRNLPSGDDGTAAGIYVRTPRGGFANNGHHTQEVMNGTDNTYLLTYRAFWFYVLNQGQLAAGTANSDSHSLVDNTVGVPRSIVYADTRPGPGFDGARFNAAVRAGELFGTNGPVIEAEMDTTAGRSRYGLRPLVPSTGGRLHLRVTAAPWVPVEEVRIVVNGEVVRVLQGAELSRPADPFGTEGLLRYAGSLVLSELLPPGGGDAWVVVEAGTRLPLAGDLGSPWGGKEPDGVPDTSDNNGDGVVDRSDVQPPERDFGPLLNPPPPTSEANPLYHFSQVVTQGYPMAFTNPFLLDRNNNGRFDAPGRGAP